MREKNAPFEKIEQRSASHRCGSGDCRCRSGSGSSSCFRFCFCFRFRFRCGCGCRSFLRCVVLIAILLVGLGLHWLL